MIQDFSCTRSALCYVRWRQCSRLNPSYEFHFEGLVRIQDVNPKTIVLKYKTRVELVAAGIIWYMFLVQCEEL